MTRNSLLAHSSFIALGWLATLVPAQAQAQTATQARDAAEPPTSQTDPKNKDKPDAEKVTAENGTDIIVRGVRSSLAVAREKKRKSDSIVDVVEAEDIGKLPNNTIGDVIASVPGIAAFREEGEVNTFQLRGLGGTQTTLNGTPIESGVERSANITDLPADLVKSVEIYKTRSPDQVEGAGAGTINVELRKPNDFAYGLTVSGNAAARYNNQSYRFNQTYTGIFNYRRATGIGDVGMTVGATLNLNPFLESHAFNDTLTVVQTRQVVGPQILPYPTYVPRQVYFAYITGSRKTPSYNGSLQWTNGNDSITLDALYATPEFDYSNNTLYISVANQANSTNTLPALSNIKLVPGTNRIASLTTSPVTQQGPFSETSLYQDSNYTLSLKAKHADERYELSTEIAYTGGEQDRRQLIYRTRFVNRPTVDIEFASEKFRYPMMNSVFSGVDLLDPDQYRFYSVYDNASTRKNSTLSSRADLRIWAHLPLVDAIQVGMRYARRETLRTGGAREIIDLSIPISQLPEGFNKLYPIAEGFGGTGVENNARWLAFDRFAARANYQKLRAYVGGLSTGTLFQTPEPAIDPSFQVEGNEKSVAAYGTIYYKTHLLFPISGIVGARVTNTAVDNRSFLRRTGTFLVNGRPTLQTIVEANEARGNYLNVEPTATAVVDFTRQLRLRLSYSVGIRRPDVNQTTAYINFTDPAGAATVGSGTAGNPALQPEKTTRYDAIVEYNFGGVGLITVNPFYWKLNGSIANFTTEELVEGGVEGTFYNITRPYNSGQGYRRGVEAQAQTFFTFLPGILRNFGVQTNYTYIESERTFNNYPGSPTAAPVTTPIENTPKHLFNVQGLFERGSLNARVSYNYISAVIEGYDTGVPVRYARYIIPRTWMDAAINYTITGGPLKNLGFSIQVQNVLADAKRSFYGYPDQPKEVAYLARTYGGTIRYRF